MSAAFDQQVDLAGDPAAESMIALASRNRMGIGQVCMDVRIGTIPHSTGVVT